MSLYDSALAKLQIIFMHIKLLPPIITNYAVLKQWLYTVILLENLAWRQHSQ